ncbi:MAG: prepilin-type N-terminal cleavage/methylation domain-containing protein [Campylobacteraceae bacterium]|jgi:general secretion pathway protein G|nr:prepilin-type N-terminal cleavage/methylation domain-containing protein [Campylobacteraceae bacterium]
MKRFAFTMVELVFVIVILGILASIAVPRLAASRDDAKIAKGKADVAAIRSSITLKRSQNILAGVTGHLDLNGTAFGSGILFDGVLDYPIESGTSGWTATSETEYFFTVSNEQVKFTYNATDGKFTCDTNGSLCRQLTQ